MEGRDVRSGRETDDASADYNAMATTAAATGKRAWQTPHVIISELHKTELASNFNVDYMYTHS